MAMLPGRRGCRRVRPGRRPAASQPVLGQLRREPAAVPPRRAPAAGAGAQGAADQGRRGAAAAFAAIAGRCPASGGAGDESGAGVGGGGQAGGGCRLSGACADAGTQGVRAGQPRYARDAARRGAVGGQRRPARSQRRSCHLRACAAGVRRRGAAAHRIRGGGPSRSSPAHVR